LGLLSDIYGAGLFCKKYIYTELKEPDRLPAIVISIGNITLGGTGKTPAVIDLAMEARKRGLNPCILTRGYRGKAKETCFISRGEGPLLNAEQAGDEAYLMAEKLKGVPIIKGKDRYRAGRFALENDQLAITPLPHSKLFILDDGFQHWKLHRDMDILLIDATNPFGNRKLFPEGIMREPFSALKRADIMVITKSDIAGQEKINAVTREIRKYNHQAPVFTASHRPVSLIDISGQTEALDSLKGKKIYAFAGIANPGYFHATLKNLGAYIDGTEKFRDHHFYTQKDLDIIEKEAAGLDIVTTEKDLVKLKGLRLPENLSALKIEFTIDADFHEQIFRRIYD